MWGEACGLGKVPSRVSAQRQGKEDLGGAGQRWAGEPGRAGIVWEASGKEPSVTERSHL